MSELDLHTALYCIPLGVHRTVCPKCLGGGEREKSLTVRREPLEAVSWICWRASCGYRSPTTSKVTILKIKEPHFYTRPTKHPTPEHQAILKARFGLPDDTVYKYSDLDDRFILPVRGPKWEPRGVVAYSLSGRSPKSLNYVELPEQPFVHYAVGERLGGSFVVVEDWFSAEKVSLAGATGVAVMGTLLTDSIVEELASLADRAMSPVILAFDRDAYAKSISYQNKYRHKFKGELKVWALSQDLKYESVERIKRALEGDAYFGKDNFSGTTQGASLL